MKCRIHDLVDSQLLPPKVLRAKPRGLFSKKGMEVACLSGTGQGKRQENGRVMSANHGGYKQRNIG